MKSKALLTKVGSVSTAAAALLQAQSAGAAEPRAQAETSAAVPATESPARRRACLPLILIPATPSPLHLVQHISHLSHSSHASGTSLPSPDWRPPIKSDPVNKPTWGAADPDDDDTAQAAPVTSHSTGSRTSRSAERNGLPSRPSNASYWPDALKPLRPNDYARLTDWQVQILKNFYYARHGYSFPGTSHVTVAVRDWFQSQSWFRPNTGKIGVVNSRMSATEKRNFSILTKEERRRATIQAGKKP